MRASMWAYDHIGSKARFSLGWIPPENPYPFVCFGVNPSTATPEQLDPTVASVARYSEDHGYRGWLMFNVYPQRATNPNNMHRRLVRALHNENVHHIQRLLKQYSAHQRLDVWCAWGTLIEKRPYLWPCLVDIENALQDATLRFVTRGARSKNGHPHHPLYLKKTAPLEEFDLKEYLNNDSNS